MGRYIILYIYNIEGYIWGVTSIGVGTLHTKRFNQKLNAKISTESELIGVSNCIA